MIKVYITKDGSLIREILNPKIGGSKNISVAEATVAPQKETFLHFHKTSEEVYYILEGEGLLSVGEKKIYVKTSDVVLIPPKTPHKIKNLKKDLDLKILCVCSPPYSHEDTELIKER